LPSYAGVRWLREADPRRRVDMLFGGSATVISDVSVHDLDRIAVSERHRVVTAPSTTAVAFICNAATGVCVDRRVRQALNFGLDVDAVIAATGRFGATPLNGPLTRLHLGDDPALMPYRYDPAFARALLAEAGYRNGLHITLDVPERLPDEAPILGQVLAEQFAAIGVETVVRSFSDRPGYAEMVRAKQIDDACCFDSTPISTYRVLREKLHGRVRGPWWQGYHNPEVDRLLDLAAATPGLSARQGLYRRAYQVVHDDAPWLFLYSPQHHWGYFKGTRWTPTMTGLVQIR
jgi:peptide/nickel transport system substrate-binding protein